MKFLPKSTTISSSSPMIQTVEDYIYNTKEKLSENLQKIFQGQSENIARKHLQCIKKLTAKRHLITIKPADKNLGIVLLNTEDYVDQCLKHLTTSTYNLVSEFPLNLKTLLENTLIRFNTDLTFNIINSKSLYHHLLPRSSNYRTPQFYGLPKIHKTFTNIPPIRPIVSQTNSLLSTTAKFLDYTLQPIARSFPDYLHNSTALIKTLSEMIIPKETILVSLDIVSLFPSIPQRECLSIINEELQSHQNILMFNPNLIMSLLELHMYNNFFEFGTFVFHQTTGIAMGAAFSPTVANIYMSVFIKKFLATCTDKPLLLLRYIDDIFILWPKNQNLKIFLESLNNFHPNIKFTSEFSPDRINFLDITIYRNEDLSSTTSPFSIKTYQKPSNLYQYLHFSSEHPKTTFKGIIIGECIRYIRTNSTEQLYLIQANLFKNRLLKRGYPEKFIMKYIKKVKYSNRNIYINNNQKPTIKTLHRPIFKTPFLPNYSVLQQIILNNYRDIEHLVNKPLFIYTSHKTLGKLLVRAKLQVTQNLIIDIYTACHGDPTSKIPFPNLKSPKPTHIIQERPKPCLHPRCKTCQHFNSDQYFRSTITKRKYRIRHSFSCTSKNIIYLITCTKCRKQYIGKTSKTLKERINRHRATIKSKQRIYFSTHFNLPNHQLQNLSVQVIDSSSPQDLDQLEHYWINTLNTKVPYGLNFID